MRLFFREYAMIFYKAKDYRRGNQIFLKTGDIPSHVQLYKNLKWTKNTPKNEKPYLA